MDGTIKLLSTAAVAGGRAGGDVTVSLVIEARTAFRSEVRVVGSDDALGAWRPEGGVALRTDPVAYPRWSGTVKVPASAYAAGEIEYKFVAVLPDRTAEWEDGPNRCLQSDVARRRAHSDLGLPAPMPAVSRGKEVVWEASCPATGLGDALLLVGADGALGGWELSQALRLTTSAAEFPLWRGSTSFGAGQHPGAWKLAIVRADGGVEWEPGEDRHTALSGLGDEEADSWVVRVMFGGVCKEPVPLIDSPEPAGSGPCLAVGIRYYACAEPAAPRPMEFEHQHVAIRAPAEAQVEVVFRTEGSGRQMRYDSAKELWALDLAEAGLKQGLHTFHFVVDGGQTLSGLHPTSGDRGSNLLHFDEGLRSYVRNLQEGPCREAQRILGKLREEAHEIGGPNGDPKTWRPRSGGKARLSSADSTVSTCTSNSEVDGGDGDSSKAFTEDIFKGLFDEELKLRLNGFVVPHDLLREGEPLRLWSSGHRLKKECGRCEDDYFCGTHAAGVADGVGSMVQFASYGCDAAAYATELMELAHAALQPGGAAAAGRFDGPVDERAAAAMSAAERRATTFGASTMSVLVLEGDTVGVANLGDSGFMLLRKGPEGMAVITRSSEQQHCWNFPYQLARLPPALMKKLPEGRRPDTAADCDRYALRVLPGDLLLLFSDGFCDNLHDHEIQQIVDRALVPTVGELAGVAAHATPPGRVARSLARAAQERSLDPRAMVPFSKNSRAQGVECRGGKPDDITVVAAWVMAEGSSAGGAP